MAEKRPPLSRFWLETRGYAEALVVAFLFVTFVFNTVGVVGASMLPTLDGGPGSTKLAESLLTGDRVLVSKYHNWLVRIGLLNPYDAGQVIVHREPRSSAAYLTRTDDGCLESILIDRCRPFLIKRVAAAPGDTLSIADGIVILNGERTDQSFITDKGGVRVHPVNFPVVTVQDGQIEALQTGWITAPDGQRHPVLPTANQPTAFTEISDPDLVARFGSLLRHLAVPEWANDYDQVLADINIPEDYYFVMGDNRSQFGSLDSRAFGLVPAVDVAGPASIVLWPPRRDGSWNWRILSVQ